MKNYNIEYQYKQYKQHPRKYIIPIKVNINNNQYNQQQLNFIRNLFPKGLNKQPNAKKPSYID